MKNFTDDGKIHFDADTNCDYTERIISFEYRNRVFLYSVAVPLKMKKVLKSEHWDAMVELGKKSIDATIVRGIQHGFFNMQELNQMAHTQSRKEMLEFIYDQFLMEQHRLGNDVWAVPDRMVDVGPPPEDDFKHCKAEVIQ